MQLSFTQYQGVAFEGDKADANRKEYVRSYVSGTSVVVPFGVAVALGASDTTCKLLSATTDKVLGVALRTHAGNANNGVAGYTVNSDISVLCEGVVWVKVEENVAAEDPVYVRAIVAGAEVAGAFRKSADSTDCIQLTKSKFLTSASAGGLAQVHIAM